MRDAPTSTGTPTTVRSSASRRRSSRLWSAFLANPMPGSARIARCVDTRRDPLLDACAQRVADLADDVVVVRLLLHRAGRAAHVHRDVRGSGVRDHRQHLGVGCTARHVVDHRRAGLERAACHGRLRRVDAHRHAGVGNERAHDGQDTPQLFSRRRPARHPAASTRRRRRARPRPPRRVRVRGRSRPRASR